MPAFGTSINRVEDRRLVLGAGEYVDDVRLDAALHVAILRSPYAHARVRTINVDAALAMPGIVRVETAAGLGTQNGPFPHPAWAAPAAGLASVVTQARPEVIRLLATDKVRYVGEAVAAIVATNRYLAEDALSAIEVDYDPLPLVMDPSAGIVVGAPLLNEDWGDNVAAHFVVSKGNIERSFAIADRVVRARVTMPRSTLTPIENRGVAARPDRRSGGLVVWSSTQQPHWLRNALERSLGLSGDRLRVIAPDVGGGFGVKSMVYPEELLVPLLALRLGQPVRWTEMRQESFLSAVHSRDQVHQIELALAADGTIMGMRDTFLFDAGASNVECLVCPYNTAAHISLPYRVPTLKIECHAVLTNKTPNAAHRGAGRPEAVMAMEGVLDVAAHELGIDGFELRRRNALRSDEMPYDAGIIYRDGAPLILDGGDYLGTLEDAAREIGWDTVRQEQPGLRAAGRHVGLGIASYVEGTGIGPYESALIRIQPSGHVVVTVATPSQGQGHETTLAQICADELGVDVAQVRVVQGDTGALPAGSGTFDSRTAVVVGNAVGVAARRLREKCLQAASEFLEAASDDLQIERGSISVIGSRGSNVGLGELSARLSPGTGQLTAVGPGLEAHEGFKLSAAAWANGVHACLVEVDVETGHVEVLRYVVVHDCGRLINPRIVEGQISGGVAQGLGGALAEELVYNDSGQLITGSFMDYGIPRSTDMPPLLIYHRETPSPRNPLGIKGVGEGGAIPVAAAVVGAVNDALRPFGVRVESCPVTPDRILALLEEVRQVNAK
jgi:aerobic carbon-monoxide dehydrogenase large subunit